MPKPFVGAIQRQSPPLRLHPPPNLSLSERRQGRKRTDVPQGGRGRGAGGMCGSCPRATRWLRVPLPTYARPRSLSLSPRQGLSQVRRTYPRTASTPGRGGRQSRAHSAPLSLHQPCTSVASLLRCALASLGKVVSARSAACSSSPSRGAWAGYRACAVGARPGWVGCAREGSARCGWRKCLPNVEDSRPW